MCVEETGEGSGRGDHRVAQNRGAAKESEGHDQDAICVTLSVDLTGKVKDRQQIFKQYNGMVRI